MTPILLTGATGYIGSHTWVALHEAGFDVVGVDDFSNSTPAVLERLGRLIGHRPTFERVNVADAAAMDDVLQRHRPEAVVHFAALKAVGVSAARPADVYANNLSGLLSTTRTMRARGCRRLVFSSSAAIYSPPRPEDLPLREDAPLSATNPCGRTKLMGEQILRDLGRADATWRTACLRYFHPAGAHPSGLMGEDPRSTPKHLMPCVAQVAAGRRPALQVFGDNYRTPDGTGMRDYIHVMDVAEGHVAALQHLLDGGDSLTFNLGTGRAHSVLEVVRAYARASGREIPWRIAPRRPGDVDACWADPRRAHELLGWRARRGLSQMCEDSWRWQGHLASARWRVQDAQGSVY